MSTTLKKQKAILLAGLEQYFQASQEGILTDEIGSIDEQYFEFSRQIIVPVIYEIAKEFNLKSVYFWIINF